MSDNSIIALCWIFLMETSIIVFRRTGVVFWYELIPYDFGRSLISGRVNLIIYASTLIVSAWLYCWNDDISSCSYSIITIFLLWHFGSTSWQSLLLFILLIFQLVFGKYEYLSAETTYGGIRTVINIFVFTMAINIVYYFSWR